MMIKSCTSRGPRAPTCTREQPRRAIETRQPRGGAVVGAAVVGTWPATSATWPCVARITAFSMLAVHAVVAVHAVPPVDMVTAAIVVPAMAPAWITRRTRCSLWAAIARRAWEERIHTPMTTRGVVGRCSHTLVAAAGGRQCRPCMQSLLFGPYRAPRVVQRLRSPHGCSRRRSHRVLRCRQVALADLRRSPRAGRHAPHRVWVSRSPVLARVECASARATQVPGAHGHRSCASRGACAAPAKAATHLCRCRGPCCRAHHPTRRGR